MILRLINKQELSQTIQTIVSAKSPGTVARHFLLFVLEDVSTGLDGGLAILGRLEVLPDNSIGRSVNAESIQEELKVCGTVIELGFRYCLVAAITIFLTGEPVDPTAVFSRTAVKDCKFPDECRSPVLTA